MSPTKMAVRTQTAIVPNFPKALGWSRLPPKHSDEHDDALTVV